MQNAECKMQKDAPTARVNGAPARVGSLPFCIFPFSFEIGFGAAR
jgi:hypothetical protein